MTAKISAPRRARKSRGVRSIFGQCAAAAVGAGLAAISMSAFGADLATGPIRPIPAQNQVISTGAHPLTSQPSAAPGAKLEDLAVQARTLDQLYDDLMRSSGCMLALSKASTGGGC
jgi:hypothetical protein